MEAACGAGQAGGAGPGPGRGAAARGASRPRGLGSLRLRLPSPPDAAMEDERKDGAYGRSRLWPAVASLGWGALGEGYVRDHKHPSCSWGPSPAARPSIPLCAELTPPCSRRVVSCRLSREPPHPLRLMGREARRMLRPGRSRYLGGSDARRGRGGLSTGARKRDRARLPPIPLQFWLP